MCEMPGMVTREGLAEKVTFELGLKGNEGNTW